MKQLAMGCVVGSAGHVSWFNSKEICLSLPQSVGRELPTKQVFISSSPEIDSMRITGEISYKQFRLDRAPQGIRGDLKIAA
jgi:hypothetical protein